MDLYKYIDKLISLLRATEARDSASVATLLNEGIDSEDNPLIMMTARKREFREIEQLLIDHAIVHPFTNDENLDRGIVSIIKANPHFLEARNYDKATPLIYACQQGLYIVATKLIEQGANLDAQNYDGATPLHYACSKGLKSVASLLIAKGANLELRTKLYNSGLQKGSSPLMIACQTSNGVIADMLIEKGANINIKDARSTMAIHYACNKNLTDIAIKLIEKGSLINEVGQNELQQCLLIACQKKNSKLALKLIEYGADVNYSSQPLTEYTPLMLGALNNMKEVVIKLIEKGALVDQVFSDRSTALSTACCSGHLDIARILIKASAVVSADSNPYKALLMDYRSFIQRISLAHEYPSDLMEVDYRSFIQRISLAPRADDQDLVQKKKTGLKTLMKLGATVPQNFRTRAVVKLATQELINEFNIAWKRVVNIKESSPDDWNLVLNYRPPFNEPREEWRNKFDDHWLKPINKTLRAKKCPLVNKILQSSGLSDDIIMRVVSYLTRTQIEYGQFLTSWKVDIIKNYFKEWIKLMETLETQRNALCKENKRPRPEDKKEDDGILPHKNAMNLEESKFPASESSVHQNIEYEHNQLPPIHDSHELSGVCTEESHINF
ncbi:MAG: ankyrin repeat domain-containing protein [Rickettsiaceae bacterium]|nr:ankyrin repeat domain-containing protein [Rickettsiaceae bacterium]